jgi:hypothetical protein
MVFSRLVRYRTDVNRRGLETVDVKCNAKLSLQLSPSERVGARYKLGGATYPPVKGKIIEFRRRHAKNQTEESPE